MGTVPVFILIPNEITFPTVPDCAETVLNKTTPSAAECSFHCQILQDLIKARFSWCCCCNIWTVKQNSTLKKTPRLFKKHAKKKHHLTFGNITKKSESIFTASLIAEHVQCVLDSSIHSMVKLEVKIKKLMNFIKEDFSIMYLIAMFTWQFIHIWGQIREWWILKIVLHKQFCPHPKVQ